MQSQEQMAQKQEPLMRTIHQPKGRTNINYFNSNIRKKTIDFLTLNKSEINKRPYQMSLSHKREATIDAQSRVTLPEIMAYNQICNNFEQPFQR